MDNNEFDWDNHDDNLKPNRDPNKPLVSRMIDDYISCEGGFYDYWMNGDVRISAEDMVDILNSYVETDGDNEEIWMEASIPELRVIKFEDLQSARIIDLHGNVDFKKALS